MEVLNNLKAPQSIEDMATLLETFMEEGDQKITLEDPEGVIQYVFAKLWAQLNQKLRRNTFFQANGSVSLTAFPIKVIEGGQQRCWMVLRRAAEGNKLRNILYATFQKPETGRYGPPTRILTLVGRLEGDCKSVLLKKEEQEVHVPTDFEINDIGSFIEREVVALLRRIPVKK